VSLIAQIDRQGMPQQARRSDSRTHMPREAPIELNIEPWEARGVS
jgi:hypothetical protein